MAHRRAEPRRSAPLCGVSHEDGMSPSGPRRRSVTDEYIPTVGEHAACVLASFKTLQYTPDADARHTPGSKMRGSSTTKTAAVQLIRSCLALKRKFPTEARRELEALLPFTRLEIELIYRG